MKTILVTNQKQTIFKCLKKRNTSKIFVLNKTLIRLRALYLCLVNEMFFLCVNETLVIES